MNELAEPAIQKEEHNQKTESLRSHRGGVRRRKFLCLPEVEEQKEEQQTEN
jgi:hypothetical protein